MSVRHNKAGAQVGAALDEQAIRSTLKADPKTSRILQVGSALGNSELQKRVQNGNANRNELLLFLVHRLETIRGAQVQEMHAAQPGEIRKDFSMIADIHKPKYTKPEPTRWLEPARIYEDAAWALCRGQLGRGAELIERAMEAERHAFDGLSAVVHHDDLDEVTGCGALGEVRPNETCGDCDLPEGVDIAKEIQNVTLEIQDVPTKKRAYDPTWTEDEEEEDEKPEEKA